MENEGTCWYKSTDSLNESSKNMTDLTSTESHVNNSSVTRNNNRQLNSEATIPCLNNKQFNSTNDLKSPELKILTCEPVLQNNKVVYREQFTHDKQPNSTRLQVYQRIKKTPSKNTSMKTQSMSEQHIVDKNTVNYPRRITSESNIGQGEHTNHLKTTTSNVCIYSMYFDDKKPSTKSMVDKSQSSNTEQTLTSSVCTNNNQNVDNNNDVHTIKEDVTGCSSDDMFVVVNTSEPIVYPRGILTWLNKTTSPPTNSPGLIEYTKSNPYFPNQTNLNKISSENCNTSTRSSMESIQPREEIVDIDTYYIVSNSKTFKENNPNTIDTSHVNHKENYESKIQNEQESIQKNSKDTVNISTRSVQANSSNTTSGSVRMAGANSNTTGGVRVITDDTNMTSNDTNNTSGILGWRNWQWDRILPWFKR